MVGDEHSHIEPIARCKARSYLELRSRWHILIGLRSARLCHDQRHSDMWKCVLESEHPVRFKSHILLPANCTHLLRLT